MMTVMIIMYAVRLRMCSVKTEILSVGVDLRPGAVQPAHHRSVCSRNSSLGIVSTLSHRGIILHLVHC